MDRIAEWRPVEPAGPDGSAAMSGDEADPPPHAPVSEQRAGASWSTAALVAVALGVGGAVLAGAVALLALSAMPRPAVSLETGTFAPTSSALETRSAATAPPSASDVVVDVQGAVTRAGVWRLPTGSRVGDAIAAAGGYSPQVDIDAASRRLNLAALLVDGQQIHVPLRGESALEPTSQPSDAPDAAATDGAAQPNGAIDINHATADELDTLPGIGPVTAAKIIAAREEAQFASVDELLERRVVGQATFEKIRSLITALP